MSIDARQVHYGVVEAEISKKRLTKDGATRLLALETTVFIDPDLGAVTIKLPEPGEGAGRIYSIYVRDTGDTSATVATVEAAGLADYTLDADGDHVLLYSDGYEYHEIVNNVAA